MSDLQLGRVRRWLNSRPLVAYGFLISVLVGTAVGAWLMQWSENTSVDWPTTLSAAANLMTIVAIIIGGLWTLYVLNKRRSHAVRAEIRHSWAVWMLGEKTFLRINVSLKNHGEVVVNPQQSYTLVQYAPKKAPRSRRPSEETWRTIEKIKHRWTGDEVVIEPGETEAYAYDVEIAPDTRFVQLHTLVECDVDSDERWDETTLIDLRTQQSSVSD